MKWWSLLWVVGGGSAVTLGFVDPLRHYSRLGSYSYSPHLYRYQSVPYYRGYSLGSSVNSTPELSVTYHDREVEYFKGAGSIPDSLAMQKDGFRYHVYLADVVLSDGKVSSRALEIAVYEGGGVPRVVKAPERERAFIEAVWKKAKSDPALRARLEKVNFPRPPSPKPEALKPTPPSP